MKHNLIKPNLLSQNNIGIEKLSQILTLIDKKYKKKLISIYGLINQINHAQNKNKSFCIYYFNQPILILLNLLKQYKIIYDYFYISPIYFKLFLLFGFKVSFYHRLLIV